MFCLILLSIIAVFHLDELLLTHSPRCHRQRSFCDPSLKGEAMFSDPDGTPLPRAEIDPASRAVPMCPL
jgi:hypothetical protein